MEQKEKLEEAKRLYETANADQRYVLESLFPELTESEDEKVRKSVIAIINNYVDNSNTFKPKMIAWLEKQKPITNKEDEEVRQYLIRTMKRCDINVPMVQKALAWLEKQGNKPQKTSIWKHWKDGIAGNGEGETIYLIKYGYTYSLSSCLGFECDYIELSELDKLLSEKQGEQKPADKVEPKFKVGDWIVNDYCIGKVIELTDDAYLLDTGQGIPFSCEHNAHLWTIQDAKEGDIIYLPNGNNEYYFFIFKGIENAAVMSFAHFYQYNDGTSKVEGTIDDLFSVNDIFQPSTKEQRDLLFQKMHEAGYMWDSESKQLLSLKAEPSGEQKTAWSEEDEKIITGIINDIQKRLEDYPLEQLAEIYFKEIKWLKSLRKRIECDNYF